MIEMRTVKMLAHYMDWHAHPGPGDDEVRTVSYCTDCCIKMRGQGFQMDLLQVAAEAELRSRNPRCTLQRVWLGPQISTAGMS